MYPAEFSYLRAGSVSEALDALADGESDDDLKILAGGQSLLPMMKLRLATPSVLLDIGGLTSLAAVDPEAGRVGALATYRSLQRDARLAGRFPAMADALSVLADPQVRARGTIGGAIAHGDPAADLPAVLLALDATLTVARSGGSRTVALDDFLRGVFDTDLADDELITEVVIPPAAAGQAYEKFEQSASHLPLAGVCAAVEVGAAGAITGARVAVTGVAGRVFRARAVEAALVGQEPVDAVLDGAAAQVRDGAPRPLEDIHASGSFRLHLAEVLAQRALRRALMRAGESSLQVSVTPSGG
ncbi:MAG: xanthine dehydrogenase family protein subunit M [Streptosporangiaceae bacterium]|nr:xanthine dehydrogenase family protein subunit M [Streptosporangiaceae bacterium]